MYSTYNWLMSLTVQKGRCYYLHFTDVENEAQRDEHLAQSHTASKLWNVHTTALNI